MLNYCPGCGEKNKDNTQTCHSCGFDLKDRNSTGSLAGGTVIDNRYEIKKLIKAGGMGAIYQAIDKRFNNKCAVKEMVIDESNKEDANYLTMRFQEEANLLRNLNNPNLPRVIDYFIESGSYYLVMDFVDGQDLDEMLLKHGNPGLPEEKIVTYAIELLDVLSYLHNQKPPIIYRDLKPANIMIRKKDNKVMLVDFGIARSLMPDKIDTVTTIGTPHYSSPEHFEGTIVPQSDIFSLGATMHHLLTGKVPAPCLFKPVRELNPRISPQLEVILEKAVALSREDRYKNAEEMKYDLEALLDILQTGNLSEEVAEEKTAKKQMKDFTRKTPVTVKHETKETSKIVTFSNMITTLLKRDVMKPFSEKDDVPKQTVQISKQTSQVPKQTRMIMPARSSKPQEEITEIRELPEIIINEKDESTMLLIQGGEFWIGNDDNNPKAVQLEKPKHNVILKSYYMDKYQITNRQYCRFLNRKRAERAEEIWIYINDPECKIEKIKNRYRVKTGYDDYPVVCVTWYGAKAYAEWAEKRLPDEAEWEVAARGPERREYPWGNEWHPKKCSNRCPGGCEAIMAVGSFPQGISYYGIEDMSGNVWEWCEDWLNAYPGNDYISENFGSKYKIVRGGAWFLENPDHFRSSFRRWYVPTFRYYFLGFRCCKTA